MGILSKLIILLLLFFLQSRAEIRMANIRLDERSEIMFDSFKFTHRGNVYISISSVSFTSDLDLQQPDHARMGFYMISHRAMEALLRRPEKRKPCILDSNLIKPLCNFSHHSNDSKFSFHYEVTYPDDYTVLFANCNPDPIVTMDVHIELYNTDDNGAKDFLSSGVNPNHCTIFLVIYGVFLVVWVILCNKNQKQPYFYTIHILMGCLLALMILTVSLALIEINYVKANGTPQGWDLYFDISHFFRDQLLFVLMVLSGLGWSCLRSPQGREKIFLVIVLVIRCMSNITSMKIRRSGPFDSNWDTWKDDFFFTHIICWGVSYVAPLRTTTWIIQAAKAPGKEYILEKKASCRWYMYTFFCYFYSKLVVLIVRKNEERISKWVTNPTFSGVDEIITLGLYLTIFYMLRPVEKNMIFAKEKKFTN